MKTLICRVALAAALSGGLGTAALAETLRDRAFGFQIAFPGKAKRLNLDQGEMPSMVVRAAVYELSNDDGFFTISAAQVAPDGQNFTDLSEAVSFARDNCVVGDETISSRSLNFRGGAGGETLTSRYEQFSGTHYDLVRYAVRGNKMYCVRGSYSKNDGAAARNFVESFSLL